MSTDPAAEAALREVLEAVHSQTGYPVHVEADPALRVMASVKMASERAPVHLVRYNPAVATAVPYLATYQCGFVLRAFAVPPSERFDVIASYRAKKEADRAMSERVRRLGKDARAQVRDQMVNGLIVQLRSVPIGLRIDQWIREAHPALRQQQETLAARQLAENMGALASEVRAMAPPVIFAANAGMNAAFAAFWAGVLGDPRHLVPYKSAGHDALGECLLALWDSLPPDPQNDKALIDAWAAELGIAGWYEYQPRPA